MKKISSSQQLKYGAFLSYVGILLYILIGLLYTPWMIRCIGQADYGLYTLAYSVISFFVFDFGISSAVQRFIAKYAAEGREDKVNQCVSLVFKLYCSLDLIVLLILISVYFFIPDIYRELTNEQIAQFKTIYLIVSVFSISSFPFIALNGFLSAHEKFVQLKGCDLLSKLITVLACIVSLLCGYGLITLVLINSIVGLIFVGIKLIIAFKCTRVKFIPGFWDKEELKSLLSFSVWTMVVALCQRSIFSLAPTILGIFESASSIAILGIAISLEAYNYSFAYALNGLFLPKISRILKDKGEILPLMIKVGRIQIFTIGLVLTGFLVIGKPFIEQWVGENYSPAYFCTLLFILPAFFLLPADVADQTLIADGKVKYRGIVYLVMGLVNIPLSIILTKTAGIYGLALSIFCAYMVRNITLYLMYSKILNINLKYFFKSTYGKMLPGLFVALVLSAFLVRLVNIQGWTAIGISAVIVSVVYVLTMYFLGLNDFEKNLMFGRISRIWQEH